MVLLLYSVRLAGGPPRLRGALVLRPRAEHLRQHDPDTERVEFAVVGGIHPVSLQRGLAPFWLIVSKPSITLTRSLRPTIALGGGCSPPRAHCHAHDESAGRCSALRSHHVSGSSSDDTSDSGTSVTTLDQRSRSVLASRSCAFARFFFLCRAILLRVCLNLLSQIAWPSMYRNAGPSLIIPISSDGMTIAPSSDSGSRGRHTPSKFTRSRIMWLVYACG